MSIESQALVWAHSMAEGAELLALLCIADHDGDGGAWPGMDTIARRARVTRDHARKLIRRLEARGEIVTDPNGGGGRRTADHMRTNRYEITLTCPSTCDHSARHRERTEVIHTPSRTAGPPHGGDPAARRGAPQPHGGANHPITTPIANLVNSSGESHAGDRGFFSEEEASEYARQVAARKRMTDSIAATRRPAVPAAPRVSRYDPRTMPPPPSPRTPEDDAAVAMLLTQESDHEHLIPPTSTICLRCGTNARKDTP